MIQFKDADSADTLTIRDNSPEGLWLDIQRVGTPTAREAHIAIDLLPQDEARLLDYLTERANTKRDRAYKGMVERRQNQGAKIPEKATP